MSEHTPTPWAVDPDHRPGMGWNAHVVEAADPDNRVCFMTSGPEGKVNAAFIVKAVNAHEALVKALEKIIDGDTCVSDGGKVHDHGYFAGIDIDALRTFAAVSTSSGGE